MVFSKIFAAFSIAEQEGWLSFWPDSFGFGVSRALAYVEEPKAPPALHKEERVLWGES